MSRVGGGAKRFLRSGVPMLAFIGLGSCGLAVLMQGKFDTRKLMGHKSMTQKEFDLQEEYRQMREHLDLADYKIIRVPKPNELKRGGKDFSQATNDR